MGVIFFCFYSLNYIFNQDSKSQLIKDVFPYHFENKTLVLRDIFLIFRTVIIFEIRLIKASS